MTWYAVGAAAVTVVSGIVSSTSQKNSAIKQGNAVSKAEGEAVVKERLNTTIRNSYNTALGQQQLALTKRQLSQQGNNISAATAAAHADADTAIAASGSIGASTQAITADIDMKSQQALDQTTDAFENAVQNFNNSLDLMVLNVDQTEPTVRAVRDVGPSTGAIVGGSIMAGLGQFASNYAMRSMQLGAGTSNTTLRS